MILVKFCNDIVHTDTQIYILPKHAKRVKRVCVVLQNAESIKMEHEKKVEHVRRLEMKRADYVKTEKAKKDVEMLESQLTVSSQAIHSASNEIIKLRETELYPQLVELIKGLVCKIFSICFHL